MTESRLDFFDGFPDLSNLDPACDLLDLKPELRRFIKSRMLSSTGLGTVDACHALEQILAPFDRQVITRELVQDFLQEAGFSHGETLTRGVLNPAYFMNLTPLKLLREAQVMGTSYSDPTAVFDELCAIKHKPRGTCTSDMALYGHSLGGAPYTEALMMIDSDSYSDYDFSYRALLTYWLSKDRVRSKTHSAGDAYKVGVLAVALGLILRANDIPVSSLPAMDRYAPAKFSRIQQYLRESSG